MAIRTQAQWRQRQRSRRIGRALGNLLVVPTAMLAMMLGGAAVLGLQATDFGGWLRMEAQPVSSAAEAAISRQFGPCGAVRVTCVVDGDTFWLDGTKFRIADINTPEIGSPQCAAEAALGRRASDRLSQLLNAGPFTLVRVDRDEDQYGRKLRIVERDGRSLGSQLVAEGLAHEWRGRREGWC